MEQAFRDVMIGAAKTLMGKKRIRRYESHLEYNDNSG